jgi:uncharacterized membrane protein YhaH (DUF805 family)
MLFLAATVLVSLSVGWAVNRWWAVGLAALLPVLFFAAVNGLDTTTREGYDDWTVVFLPFYCFAVLMLVSIGLSARRWRDRRRDRTDVSA